MTELNTRQPTVASYHPWMERQEILSVLEPTLKSVSAEITDFAVGFALLTTESDTPDAAPAGSGVLVTVGSVEGLLTAAHGLDNRPDHDGVGLVQCPRTPSGPSRMTINMEES